jgi:hypothetical protein
MSGCLPITICGAFRDSRVAPQHHSCAVICVWRGYFCIRLKTSLLNQVNPDQEDSEFDADVRALAIECYSFRSMA